MIISTGRDFRVPHAGMKSTTLKNQRDGRNNNKKKLLISVFIRKGLLDILKTDSLILISLSIF